MSKSNFKRYVINLFLKSVISETVRKSAGKELDAAGSEEEARKRALRNLVPSRGVT